MPEAKSQGGDDGERFSPGSVWWSGPDCWPPELRHTAPRHLELPRIVPTEAVTSPQSEGECHNGRPCSSTTMAINPPHRTLTVKQVLCLNGTQDLH